MCHQGSTRAGRRDLAQCAPWVGPSSVTEHAQRPRNGSCNPLASLVPREGVVRSETGVCGAGES